MSGVGNKTVTTYKGTVHLSFNINGKKCSQTKHNSGLPKLRQSFYRFILGYQSTPEDIPQYLDVRKTSGDWSTEGTTCLVSLIPLSGKTNWEEGQYSSTSQSGADENVAKLTAVVSSTSLIKQIVNSDASSYRLYLCSGETSYGTVNYLAYLDTDAETLSKITPGTQMIVEWSMELKIGEDVNV